jgi:His/Glu/Gln/Arg/opine family amino acid ABC transporter permease subunit
MIINMYLPLLLKGASITIAAWLSAGIMSICIGIFLGIVSCNYLASPLLSTCITLYTFVTKGIPAYVQILIIYFIVPALTGINISGFAAGTCALGLCSSGYITEIIRSHLNAIPQGQWDACFVLGYSLRSTLTHIILPQAIINASPTLLGELEQLLKSTSLLATIGVLEVTRAGMNIISREMNPIAVYSIIAGIYLLFSFLARCFSFFLTQRIMYGKRY